MVSKETAPGIIGLGSDLGRLEVNNAAIAEFLGRKLEVVNRMMVRVGIEKRYWADRNQATSDLAHNALVRALEMAGKSPESLKAIIVGTMSGDYDAVPVSAILQHKIGAKDLGNYYDLGAACVGFLHSLYEAYKSLTSPLGEEGPYGVIGAEVISRSIHPSKPETFMLFGDAAGAVIVDNVPDTQGMFKHISFQFGADGSRVEDLYVPAGGSKRPPTTYTVRMRMHSISMRGKPVKDQAVRRMAECMNLVFEKSGLKPGDVAMLFPHQANLEIIEEVAKSLNFPMEKVYVNIHRIGNTSAASIPVALTDAYYEGKLFPNQIIGMCSFGAGMEYGGALIPTVGLPILKAA